MFMIEIINKILNPQASRVYGLLGNGGEFTAKDIAVKLKIFPNAVYREIKQLEDLGLVDKIGKYPVKYQTKKPEEAAGFLTDLIRQSFFKNQINLNNQLQLSFIQNRKELLAFTNKDTKQAKESLNIIVSGHEVPAETILAQKRAADRGVRVRILIQDLSASSKERIRAWQKMGIEIRYLKYMQARVLIFDKKIVYFTSYSETKNHEAIGMRFEYEPYARLMGELFEQKWKEAKDVKLLTFSQFLIK